MQVLTIDASSEDSARGLCGALTRFQPELVETENGGYAVRVPLGGSSRATVEVLNALQDYLARRDSAPARVELDGRKYLLDAAAARDPNVAA